MGRRGAVRRKLCLRRKPRKVAVHRYYAGGEAAQRGDISRSRFFSPPPAKRWGGVGGVGGLSAVQLAASTLRPPPPPAPPRHAQERVEGGEKKLLRIGVLDILVRPFELPRPAQQNCIAQ